jgi:beta-lactam-binding protein with PASTA domain
MMSDRSWIRARLLGKARNGCARLVVVTLICGVCAAGCTSSTRATVPHVVGRSAARAEVMLRDAGLKFHFGTFLRGVPGMKIKAGSVFREPPSGGSQVPRGTSVELTLYG